MAMDNPPPGTKAAGTEVVIPGAASLAGAYGTQWESDFRFFNPCFHDVEVYIEFQPDNTENVGMELVSRDLSLYQKTTMYFDNIFDLMPDLGGGEVSGSLRIESSSVSGCSAVLVSRTFDDTPDGTLGLSVPAMPVEVPDEFNLKMSTRRAVFKQYAQAIPGAFAIDKRGISPCRFACPAGVNAHAYVTLIAQRRFKEALEVQRRQNPFPAICGRVCPHACEAECTRNRLDEPLAGGG